MSTSIDRMIFRKFYGKVWIERISLFEFDGL